MEKYQEEVLTAYKQLNYENGAFHNLKNPTPANLRNEAAMLYEKRTEGGEILRLFSKQGTVSEGIGKLDIDKFRPVSHFLIDKTNNPNLRVVELVAWLIDFNPRPYETWRKQQKDANNTGKEGKGGGKIEPPQPTTKFWEKHLILLGLLIALIIGGAYTYWQDRTERLTISKNEKCMYWTGNHYEAIACNLTTRAPKIPLNLEKLNRLKRVAEPNTLTKYSLGKVWYTKINGELEYFTDSGLHPVDTTKRLKPMTEYMLNKYISYDRFLLNLWVWPASVFFIVAIPISLIFYSKRKTKPKLLKN